MFLARDHLSIKYIEKRLQMTPYKIKSNIQLLNRELEGIAEIKQGKDEYSFQIYNFKRLEQVMSGTFKRESDFNSSSKRIAYILRKLILNKGYHVIQDIAEDLSVSRNTVNNDLKEARQLTGRYNVTIESATNRGIRIVGKELDKRMVYINLVQDYFTYKFLSVNMMNEIKDILSKYEIPKNTVTLVLKAVDVLNGSLEARTFLEDPIPFYRNAIAKSEVFVELISFYEEHNSISLSQYELDFLSFPFNVTNLNQKAYFIRDEVPYLHTVFDQMIDWVEESFVIDLNKEYLYSEMSNHLFYLINRSIFYTPPKEMFFGEIEKKYPFSFEIAKVAATSIGNEINRTVDSTEVDYLTLYFEMALRSSTMQKKLNVAVISNSGHSTASLIRRQIDSVVGEGTNFTEFTEENYLEADLTKFFVIFTTIPIQDSPKAVPVIRLSNILNEQWLINELEKVISTNPNLINSVLHDVYTLDGANDYQTNMKNMMNKMQEDGLIGQKFINRISKREEKQKTIFNNKIAFPHEINPDSQDIVLTLGVFDEEYKVENKFIRVIFLLAVPEDLTANNESKLLELYDLIFRLAKDINFTKDFSSITNRTEVIEYLESRRLSL